MPRSRHRRSARTGQPRPLEGQAGPGTSHKATPSAAAGSVPRVVVRANTAGSELAALQGTAGNRAVAGLLRIRRGSGPPVVQARLMVGAADDPLEREADKVADQVIRAWSSSPASATTGEVDEGEVHRLADPRSDPGSAFEADAAVASRLAARRGAGQALPGAVRSRMEVGFGADFSAVRVHRDSEAAGLSNGLAARAFTHGSDIYFGAGAFDPGSRSGQHLLAHELAHVVQQGSPSCLNRSSVQRKVNAADLDDGRLPYRQEMEEVFGESFSSVTVRVGRRREMEALGASASNRQDVITFADRNPSKAVIAHELVHVVQNRRSKALTSGVSDPASPAEAEATAIAGRAARGQSVTVTAPPGGAIQRVRLPADIESDVQKSLAPLDVGALLDLLREAKKAQRGAVRTLFPSKSEHAGDYAALAGRIEWQLQRQSDRAVKNRLGRKAGVIINGHKMAGAGDLVLARHCADALTMARFRVLIVSNAVDEMKRMAPQYASVIRSSDAAVDKEFSRPAAFVHVGGQAAGKGMFPRLGIPGDTPLVKLLEYGFSPQAAQSKDADISKAFGLGPGELGIFVDEDLQGRAAATESTSAKKGRRSRVAELESIDDSEVKRVLFGDEDPKRGTIEKYLASTDLYFGYAHSRAYVNHFVNLVLAYEHVLGEAGKSRIDIFTHATFPSSDTVMVDFAKEDLGVQEQEYADLVEKGEAESFKARSLKYKLQYRRDLRESHLPAIKALGVGTLEVRTRKGSKSYTAKDEVGELVGPKHLRLLDLFPLNPADYNHLLVASGALSLATGDQSYSQAVSANKLVIYEIYNHKVPLFNSWLERARKEFPGGPLVRFLEAYTVAVGGTGDPPDRKVGTFEELQAMVAQPGLRQQFSEFNQLVGKDSAAKTGVVATVRDVIGDRVLPWQRERDALIRRIEQSKKTERQDFALRFGAAFS